MINPQIGKVAEELNLPVEVVEKGYKAYWWYIKSTIEALPLKEYITEEEFNKLKTNFNIPSLGKLSCTLDRFKGMKKRYEYIKKIRNGECNR